MRKAQKQEILGSINSLHQAHEEIKETLRQKNFIQAQNILTESQAKAVSFGEMIEKAEGEGHITVSHIEEYCELLFRVFEDIDKTDLNENKAYKILRKQLIKIENSVKNDIAVRKEVAFFPYKASMWDSLESVYLAAKADPDCDAYCVPIPYYDLKPDHSFGEMHYEGNVRPDGMPIEYPKNIEITDWQTYDFEEREPDEIYIHNGYDNWNLVTSVHPWFYSDNLKKHTEKLIYIPYFVLGEIEPDDQAAIEGMKHFCFMPGIINADKVIVQSEKMKQIYVSEYMKAAKVNGLAGKHLDRKYLEEKFLGLGSPKIDKVLNTRKEDIEIPIEWLKVIKKADGSWKKIIFYNTSVGALLQHNEKMLQKMEYVFRVFQENQDEVALLWRPHPLIQATVESMRTQLWIEYDKLVRKYREEGWGIYDDTSDVDRAIALSDAYYGDGSSIVQMYQQTGKPIMMQNVQILEPTRYEFDIASAKAICYYREFYYFVQEREAVLCKMDSKTLKCEVLYKFNEKDLTEEIYSKIVPYQSWLFLIPHWSDQIAIFNITSKEIKFIRLNEDYVDIRWQKKLISSKFNDVLVQGKMLYMIPDSYHAIVKLDMEKMKLEEIPLGKKGTEIFSYCLGTACIQGNKIIFPIYSEGGVGVFNINTNKVQRVYPIGSKKKYTNIFSIENQLWLIPEKLYEGIDIWDIENETLRETIRITEQLNVLFNKNEIMDIREGFLSDRKLYLLPQGLDYGVFIDINTKNAEIWELPNKYEKDVFPPELLYLYGRRYNLVSLGEEKAIICGLRGEWVKFENGEARIIEKQSVWKFNEIKYEGKLKMEDLIKSENEAETSVALSENYRGKIIYDLVSKPDGN